MKDCSEIYHLIPGSLSKLWFNDVNLCFFRWKMRCIMSFIYFSTCKMFSHECLNTRVSCFSMLQKGIAWEDGNESGGLTVFCSWAVWLSCCSGADGWGHTVISAPTGAHSDFCNSVPDWLNSWTTDCINDRMTWWLGKRLTVLVFFSFWCTTDLLVIY